MNRRLLAALAVIVVVAGAAWVHLAGEREVRLEITARSGTVSRIQWRAGGGAEQSAGGRLPTPWSTTITVKRLSGIVTLAALSTRDDEVTCRIAVDGEPATESTANEATGCTATLS
ncbi:MmpS family transport accessory protein [Actinoplanes sp. NPDC023714]|uniref:MmpS family transport accessory protein n=1 Tax=Actinoplanes sp. NPDC023714 TaxID=3154322 RepID=UPI0033C05E1E